MTVLLFWIKSYLPLALKFSARMIQAIEIAIDFSAEALQLESSAWVA